MNYTFASHRVSASTAVLGLFAALLFTSPAVLQAQTTSEPDPRCTARGQGGDACQKAVDLFQYLNPQIGTLIAGGNATLGQGGTLGGLGRFALTLRVNATDQLAVPDLENTEFQEGAPRRSRYTTTQTPGGFPVADLAVGLYKGYPLGPTRVGGVDALVNVFYLPESATELLEGEGLSLSGTETGLKLGYGARVGLVQEGRLWPGVSVTYLRRSLPTVNVSISDEDFDNFGNRTSSDTLSLRGFQVQTDAWRLVAGKRFLWIFNVAAGIGQDRYDTGGQLAWAVRTERGQRIRGDFDFGQQVTRTNMFADLSLNLFLFRVVGEIGRVSGGNVQTFNQFDTDPNAPRTYGALGIRIGR